MTGMPGQGERGALLDARHNAKDFHFVQRARLRRPCNRRQDAPGVNQCCVEPTAVPVGRGWFRYRVNSRAGSGLL